MRSPYAGRTGTNLLFVIDDVSVPLALSAEITRVNVAGIRNSQVSNPARDRGSMHRDRCVRRGVSVCAGSPVGDLGNAVCV